MNEITEQVIAWVTSDEMIDTCERWMRLPSANTAQRAKDHLLRKFGTRATSGLEGDLVWNWSPAQLTDGVDWDAVGAAVEAAHQARREATPVRPATGQHTIQLTYVVDESDGATARTREEAYQAVRNLVNDLLPPELAQQLEALGFEVDYDGETLAQLR